VVSNDIFLLIHNNTACDDSDDSDDSDDDGSNDDRLPYIKMFFGSLSHRAFVKICSSLERCMFVYQPIESKQDAYIGHIDKIIRASGQVPVEIQLYDPNDQVVKEYVQRNWPGYIVRCTKNNDCAYRTQFNSGMSTVRDWLLQRKDHPQDPQEEDMRVDEPETDESRSCPICLANKKKVTLLPCGHCVCFECSDNLVKKTPGQQKSCPVCRSTYSFMQRVFV